MRLIPGPDGNWWVVSAGRAALVGAAAVNTDSVRPVLRADVHSLLLGRGDITQPPPRFGLTVLTSSDCNLGCSYCWQHTALDPTGNRHERYSTTSMSLEAARRSVEYARERAAITGCDGLSTVLFGGEPLMNLPACLTVASEAGPHGPVHVITNGVLLTPRSAQRLVEAGLTGAQVTFDGDREDHNTARVTRASKGTFDKILANVTTAMEQHPQLDWRLRVNVTAANLPRIGDLIERLAPLTQLAPAALDLAPVDDVGFGGSGLPFDADTVDRFVDVYREAHQRGFTIAPALETDDCVYCRDPETGITVDADGNLYSCWESAGDQELRVGSLTEGRDHNVTGRWVACDYDQPHPTGAQRQFADAVDDAILRLLTGT